MDRSSLAVLGSVFTSKLVLTLQEMWPSVTAHFGHKQRNLCHHNMLCDDAVTKYLSSLKVRVKAPSMTIESISSLS